MPRIPGSVRAAPAACWLAASLFLAFAIFLPREWARDLPSRLEAIQIVPGLSRSPVSGTTLLRLCFLVDALVLFGCGFRAGHHKNHSATVEPTPHGSPASQIAAPTRGEMALVLTITVAALALRLHRAGSDLWVDEIVNLQIFRSIPALHVIASYRIVNNHLMNTLFVKAMVNLFDEAEWAVRFPAILFGVLTPAALWAASRRALGPYGALLAALALALSYHHVFYSQNARGYSGLLFFAVAATGLMPRALDSGRPAAWAAYIAAMLGALASMLHGFFVLGGHAVATALHIAARRARAVMGAAVQARRPCLAFGLVAYLGVHLYAVTLPDAVGSVMAVYQSAGMGYRPFSIEHLHEWARGLSAGAGPGGLVAAVLFLLVGAAGLVLAYRRDPVFVGGLAWPVVLTGVLVVVGRLNVTPRSFLLGLPLALVGAVASLIWAIDRAAGAFPTARRLRPALTLGAAAVLAGVSCAALGSYYRYPKQDFRSAIRYVESHRRPSDIAVAVYLSKAGYQHYGPKLGLVEGRDFAVVQSVAEIEGLRRQRPEARLYAVTTLTRATRIEYPALQAYIERRFRLLRRFPGTLGDGDVSVWVEMQPVS